MCDLCNDTEEVSYMDGLLAEDEYRHDLEKEADL